MNLYIDPNWDFYQVYLNIRALRSQYEDILRSFSDFQIKQIVKFKYETRDKFYALNIPEWQIDMLWEYMNDFCPITAFLPIIISYKRKNRQK